MGAPDGKGPQRVPFSNLKVRQNPLKGLLKQVISPA